MTTQVKGDQVIFDEGAAASTPAAAKVTVYAKSDGLMYSKDDAGVETLMSGGAPGMSSFNLAGDAGTPQAITNGNTATIAGGTGLSSTAGATDTVTINLDNTAVTPGSYTNADITVDAQGRLTAAANGSATPWRTDSNVVNLVTDTDTVTIGSATAGGKLFIDGDADEVQLQVQANGTQSNYLALFEDSAANAQIAFTGNGGAIFNEEGNDADFRVETDGSANTLFVDGGNNNVGINTNAPDSDVIFDVVSTTKASRPFPTMDSTQRDAIATPAAASVIYNSTTTQYEYWDGAAWAALGGSSFLSPSPQLLMNTLATKTVVQGTWANTVNGSQMYGNLYTNISGVAINDEFEFEIALAAGTYTFKLLSLKDNTSGIVTVSIDGGSIGTIDLYSAGGAVNQVNSITSIVIAATGTKTINFKMASKNASSSNYVAYLTMVQFIKTA